MLDFAAERVPLRSCRSCWCSRSWSRSTSSATSWVARGLRRGRSTGSPSASARPIVNWRDKLGRRMADRLDPARRLRHVRRRRERRQRARRRGPRSSCAREVLAREGPAALTQLLPFQAGLAARAGRRRRAGRQLRAGHRALRRPAHGLRRDRSCRPGSARSSPARPAAAAGFMPGDLISRGQRLGDRRLPRRAALRHAARRRADPLRRRARRPRRRAGRHAQDAGAGRPATGGVDPGPAAWASARASTARATSSACATTRSRRVGLRRRARPGRVHRHHASTYTRPHGHRAENRATSSAAPLGIAGASQAVTTGVIDERRRPRRAWRSALFVGLLQWPP